MTRMHIKQKFLEAIKNGTKKREYRLATPDRREIKVGDKIELIANEDDNISICVEVKKIELYSSLSDALIKYWEEDFKDVTNDFSRLINECKTFYKESDVNKYGIIVFEIKYISK